MRLFYEAWQELKAEADSALKRKMQVVWERVNDSNATTNVARETTEVVAK